MADIISFHTVSHPRRLEKLLLEERWTELAEALRNGGAHVLVHETPLWAAIMQGYSLANLRGTLAAPLPMDLSVLDVNTQTCFSLPQGPAVTAVAWGAFCGQWQWTEQLIAQGFTVDTSSFPIWTALMDGASRRAPAQRRTVQLVEQDPITVRALTQRLSPLDREGLARVVDAVWAQQPLRTQEALYWLALTVLFQQRDMMELILAKQPNLNVEQTTGATHPAVLAAETNDVEALEVLVAHGAPWILPSRTHSLLDFSVMADALESVDWIVRNAPPQTLVRMLPNAMVYASAFGRVDVLSALHQVGAAVGQTASNGYNLLHQAAVSGQMESIEWLMEQGLSLNTPAHNGIRPLDLLWQHHPKLAQRFSDNPSNVRPLRVV